MGYIYTGCDVFVPMLQYGNYVFSLRGCEILNNGGSKLLRQVFYRHDPVVVRKKNS